MDKKAGGAIIIWYRYALDRETVFSVKLASPAMEKKSFLRMVQVQIGKNGEHL